MKNRVFPYKTKLDFQPLQQFWQETFDESAYKSLLKSKNPTKWVQDNKDQAKRLLSILFPVAQNQSEIVAAMKPFVYEAFYATDGYYNLFSDEAGFDKALALNHQIAISDGKIIKACILILEKIYGYDLKLNKEVLFTLPNRTTGLNRIYKLEVDERFVSIEKNRNAKKPEPHLVKKMVEDRYNVDSWLSLLPPDDYSFSGFMMMRLTDVTAGEMISSIKADLLQKDAVLKQEVFTHIQENLRSVLNAPDLKLGLAFFDLEKNLVTPTKSRWNSVIVECNETFKCNYHAGSIYERSYLEERVIHIENIDEMESPTSVEKNLLSLGIKNIVVAPLISKGEVIGILELASPTPGAVSIINSHFIDTLLPMFVIAVERVVDDMEGEVRSIIQKEFTSIHPTVSWKFYEEGIRLLQRRRAGELEKTQDVKFENVHPLYGLSDIRNSSEVRAQAIKEDLLENIELSVSLLSKIMEKKNLQILHELVYKLEMQKKLIFKNLNSEFEIRTFSLIQEEVNPVLQFFEKQDKEFRTHYEAYKQRLGNEQVIFDRRKSFEFSVNQLNQTIASHLVKQQEKIQTLFPHYFEFFKTDGVEYNIYIGQSLVKDHAYHDLYLKNLRLWQLLTTAELAIISEDLKGNLPTPLSVAHLILVQSEAMDIKFRQDEKRFDVDGAYNVRYEIVKKRIDKAKVKGTNERVTQPGKIAIIYSHSSEINEYRRYIRYLQHLKYLDHKVEELALEDLQGANGLKALRVEVKMDHNVSDWSTETLQSIISQIELTNS